MVNYIGMKYMFKKSIVIISVVVLLFSFLIPFDLAEEEIADGWWEKFSRDKNHNNIDDSIDEKIASGINDLISIYIDYVKHPTQEDIEQLINLDLDITYICKFIDTICVENVPISKITSIKNLPNIIMIEEQLIIYPLLDVSARAIKARESTEYSPETAWELGYQGQGVNIAIIDTGVDDDHESLQGKFVAGVDFTDDSPWAQRDGSTNPDDRNGHGTHCAGIAMGTGGNDEQYKGIAPGASLIDVKVLTDVGAGGGGNLLEGIEWCIEHKDDEWGDSDSGNDGIDILSISIGGFNSDDDGQSADSRAANKAVERGLVVVAAIGNDGNDHQGISSPAAADNVIAVGSFDDQDTVDRSDDTIASHSNSGPREDDGDDDHIDELKPEIVAPGSNIYSAYYAVIGQQGVGYVQKDGTSMATPHIAGVAALMLQANPDLKPIQLKEIIKETAEARGEPYDVNLSDKYNELFGWGIVDAYKAVKYVVSGETPDDIYCNINSPLNGENVTDIIEITGTASSTSGSIDSIEVKIDNGDWQIATGTDSWDFKWDTKKDPDGNHFIQVKAISDDNEAFDSVNVVVNNSMGSSGDDDLWYESLENIIAISAGSIIIGVVVVIVLKRR